MLRFPARVVVRSPLLFLFGLAMTCGDDGNSSSGAGGSAGAGVGGSAGAGAVGGSGGTSPIGGSGSDIVWIETPEIEHTKDYHALADWVNPNVPKDWTSPVNYADGEYTLRVELTEMSDPAAQPIYYLVGWKPGDENQSGYVRTGFKIEDGVGVYEKRSPMKNVQNVVDGKDAGAVGDDWDWSNAWRSPNGDAWDANPDAELYPFKVKVTVILHPAQ